LRRGISEFSTGKPVVESTVVISGTGGFMKRSLAEFTKLEGKHLAQCGRNVVDAVIRGSYDIYMDSMQRVKYNHENPPDKDIIKQIEEHRIDCEVSEDEEPEERFGVHQP
jgi:hypothetical protein